MIRVEPVVSPRVATAAAPPTPPSLAVGSVFAVEAIRDAGSNQLLLLFAGRRWAPTGHAAADLSAGARVLARVVRAEPDVELALLPDAHRVMSALRRELPRQASPLRLLANLAWLARPRGAAARACLPEPVRTALDAAWRALPPREQLSSPDGLEAALRQTGLRLERLLASGHPAAETSLAVANDWKAALCRLHDALLSAGAQPRAARAQDDRPPPPSRGAPLAAVAPESATLPALDDVTEQLDELAQQARGSLARITCQQLAHLDGPGLPLVVEIPHRSAPDPGVLRLRIDRDDGAARAESEAVWSVEFALDLGAHGALRGRVTLAHGRISVALQPERGAFAQAAAARVDELRSALEGAGLEVGRLSCARSDPVDPTATGAWLVDLRA